MISSREPHPGIKIKNKMCIRDRVNGIRAAVCSDTATERLVKQHNNANIIAFGERIVGVELAKDIVKAYLTAEFEGGRHAKRVAMISDIEARN